MLRALFVLGLVSSCAPVAAVAPVRPLASPALTVASDSLRAVTTAREARAESANERTARPRPQASRLSPPFGSSAGVRRVVESSDAAADPEREIVAAAAERD